MRAPKVDTEIRREQIVQSALDLMASQGVQALSIASLAKCVGIVPSGIYRHFKSKDELLDATLELVGKRLIDNINQARQTKQNALERLQFLLTSELQLLLENQAIPHLVFSESIFTASKSRKAKVRKILGDYFYEVGKIILEGQKSGQIRKDADAASMALMFKGMILPAIVLWKVTGGNVDLSQHAETAWKLFCSAVSNSYETCGKTNTAGASVKKHNI